MLNDELLPGNACFGCGHENPHGLRIEVLREADAADALCARFEPTERMSGFPGVTHGGAIFTAMDCLATWVVTLLGPAHDGYWLLGGADVRYTRAARAGRPLRLVGRLATSRPRTSRTVDVRIEVFDPAGERVAEGTFHEVPVSPERFKEVAGVDAIPAPWRRLFETGRQ